VIQEKPTLQRIHDPLISENTVVFVLRLDTVHPYVSGNKIYKLKYNLEAFLKSGNDCLVTFGGAYSNHIVATAAACKEKGIRCIGIIRGDELNKNSNVRLRFANDCGMKLVFIKRDLFRQLLAGQEEIEDSIRKMIPEISDRKLFILPEGGAGELAVQGCREILKEIPIDFSFICCACGTGTTLAGISTGLQPNQKAIGIPVLHSEIFLKNDILKMNNGLKNFELLHGYHFGGYAKQNPELEKFCHDFGEKHGIPLEPVYTGKLFYAVFDRIRKNYFPPSTSIVLIHTGGVLEDLCRE
jgi:1-aminocyclopropane-1-carboxylate deaminase